MYTIGLSLSTLIFVGFLINVFYPPLGIHKPFSPLITILTTSLLVLLLSLICYIRDKNYSNSSFIYFQDIFSIPVLFLLFIPFLSIFGTYFVNYLNNNLILMLMIIIISFVVYSIGWTNFIPDKLYPLALWTITLSLVWHNTLISNYLNIYDVTREFYYTKLVIEHSYWDWALFSNYNSVLSNVVLGPIFYYFCNLNLTFVFKIIFPLLFSFVPVGLYSIYKAKFDNSKFSFLSCTLFLSINPVYNEISSTTKQSTAEIFLILLLMLLLVDSNIARTKKSFLIMIFSVSMVVSHYGISYILAGALVFTVLLLHLVPARFYKNHMKITDFNNNKIASSNFIIFYLVFTLSWYIFLSGSSSFISFVNLISHVANTLFTEFLDPESSRGLYLIVRNNPSVLATMYKCSHLLIQLLITVGLFSFLIIKNEKLDVKYILISLYFFLINLAAICFSGFAVMNAGRLYHLSLFLLAPFFILGVISASKIKCHILKVNFEDQNKEKLLKISSTILVIYLLFNTGFIFEINKDSFNSIAISQGSILKSGDKNEIAELYFRYIPESDVFSARWLSDNVPNMNKTHIYATLGHGEGKAVLGSYGMIPYDNMRMLDGNTTRINKGDYIYLHYVNVIYNIGLGLDTKLGRPIIFDMSDISYLLENKLYDNGGSEIFGK